MMARITTTSRPIGRRILARYKGKEVLVPVGKDYGQYRYRAPISIMMIGDKVKSGRPHTPSLLICATHSILIF